jgi:hypothetical protein
MPPFKKKMYLDIGKALNLENPKRLAIRNGGSTSFTVRCVF